MKLPMFLIVMSLALGLLAGAHYCSLPSGKRIEPNPFLTEFLQPELRKSLFGMSESALFSLLGGRANGWSSDGSTTASYLIENDESARTCTFLMVRLRNQKVVSAEIVPGDIYGGIKRYPTTREEFLSFLVGKRF